MRKSVQVSSHGHITVVTLSRPDVRNAVDAETAHQLYEAFLGFESDSQARVAVFHGDHGHFCAGWDLQAGARLAQAHASAADMFSRLNFSGADYVQQGQPVPGPQGPMGPSRLMLSKPVIAAVSGAAVAGGMELALWCDMRVMEDDAYFGVYCRRFGVPLIDGGTVRLPRMIGMGHAMDLILTGRKLEPAEALAMGLCNRVEPKGQGLQAAMALAEQLAGFPQQTMLADRASAYAQWDMDLPDALHEEWERGKACIASGLEGAGRFAAGAGRHGKF
ncbi:MAG: crotonase/enoyl-CoA hydratase family protein [Burkholderiales bacterium]|nr:crotonase/enoyl-CoA hydratase family protein [Burkholderiales bacterium]